MVSAQNQNVLRAAQNAATNTRRPTGKSSLILMYYNLVGDVVLILCVWKKEANK